MAHLKIAYITYIGIVSLRY